MHPFLETRLRCHACLGDLPRIIDLGDECAKNCLFAFSPEGLRGGLQGPSLVSSILGLLNLIKTSLPPNNLAISASEACMCHHFGGGGEVVPWSSIVCNSCSRVFEPVRLFLCEEKKRSIDAMVPPGQRSSCPHLSPGPPRRPPRFFSCLTLSAPVVLSPTSCTQSSQACVNLISLEHGDQSCQRDQRQSCHQTEAPCKKNPDTRPCPRRLNHTLQLGNTQALDVRVNPDETDQFHSKKGVEA